ELFIARFFKTFNRGFERLTNRYIQSLDFLMTRKWLSIAGLVLITGLGVFLMIKTPSSFIPAEDDGFVTVSMAMPPGASLARTTEVLRRADSVIKQREELQGITTIS